MCAASPGRPLAIGSRSGSIKAPNTFATDGSAFEVASGSRVLLARSAVLRRHSLTRGGIPAACLSNR